MKKSEIIATVLSAVANETEIDIQTILSQDRRREVVDARHITIVLMSRVGIYPAQIADLFGMTTRGVRYITASFSIRTNHNPTLNSIYETIKKQHGSNWVATQK